MANSADVVGWACDGALYCKAHKPERPEDYGYGPNPVFLDDAQDGDTCDTCGEALLD